MKIEPLERELALHVMVGALSLLLLVACPFTRLAGQRANAPIVRVRWAAANALVYPDSTNGVQLWFATNSHARQNGRPAPRELQDGFIPDSIELWSIYTRQLLMLHELPVPGDTASIFSSGILRGQSGTTLVAGRTRDGDHFNDGVRLLVVPKEGAPLLFELKVEELDTLLTALETASQRAHVSPRAPATRVAKERCAEVDPDRRAALRYPEDLKRAGVEGEVWADFVVDSTGRVELPTYRALLSDDPEFERVVRNFLAQTRFRPAEVDDRPVRQRVQQRFTFSLRP